MEIFDRQGLRDRSVRALEIGSFEGLSSCFLLKQLPLASLTCVDTWAGSDEHAGMSHISSIESAFDNHVAPWRDRVTKCKGYSYQRLAAFCVEEKFDFIYVDGSHHGDDVMADAIRGFEHLKVGVSWCWMTIFGTTIRVTLKTPPGQSTVSCGLSRVATASSWRTISLPWLRPQSARFRLRKFFRRRRQTRLVRPH